MIRRLLLFVISLALMSPVAQAKPERFPIARIGRLYAREYRLAKRNGWNVPNYRLSPRFGGRLRGGPRLFPTLRFAPQ